MSKKETAKKELITEEHIKAQSNQFRYIGNDGLLHTRKDRYIKCK